MLFWLNKNRSRLNQDKSGKIILKKQQTLSTNAYKKIQQVDLTTCKKSKSIRGSKILIGTHVWKKQWYHFIFLQKIKTILIINRSMRHNMMTKICCLNMLMNSKDKVHMKFLKIIISIVKSENSFNFEKK